jgi:hypothetical protein
MEKIEKIPSIELIPPKINTIFWIRHESFQNRNQAYFDLNLVMDGVLEDSYAQIEKSDSDERWLQNVYLTGQNFENELHLFYINATQFRIKTELENIRSLIKPKFSADQQIEILVIDETDTFREEYFKLSEPKTNFHYLQ